MAHFVALRVYVPPPEDDIEFLYAASDGTATAGLWGCKEGTTVLTVRVVAGPGAAKPMEFRGAIVQAWSFTGLTAASRVQAFSGSRPMTAVLEVRMSPGGNLAGQNKALLEGSDPAERAMIDGQLVAILPLEAAIGDYVMAPKMETIRGLAVHITGGLGAADGFKATFESRGASAHFVIDRAGDICQYVAASINAQAQGPGNAHFLSVEMVGSATNRGACQEMTEQQLGKLRALWGWVRRQHQGVPNRLGWAYSGSGKFLSSALTPLYQEMARTLATSGYCNNHSDSIPACIDSWGLTCHYWLDNAPKPCPGIGMMGQLTQVLGWPRVRVKGDEDFVLS